jgi:hypothetical protein
VELENKMPRFCRRFSKTLEGYLEVRLCLSSATAVANLGIRELELSISNTGACGQGTASESSVAPLLSSCGVVRCCRRCRLRPLASQLSLSVSVSLSVSLSVSTPHRRHVHRACDS